MFVILKEFILKLYENEHFVLYLTIALIIFIILFILIFIFGKKDQKLEETKRLQKIDFDKNKKPEEVVNKEEKKTQFSNEKTGILDNKVIVNNTNSKVEVTDSQTNLLAHNLEEEKEPKEPNVIVFEPEINNNTLQSNELAKELKNDVIAKNDEIDNIAARKSEEINATDEKLQKELNKLEKIKNEFNNIEIPQNDQKVPYKPASVFSSVYVNDKKNASNKKDLDLHIEEPSKSQKMENNNSEKDTDVLDDSIFFQTTNYEYEEDNFDMPTLKKQ